MTRPVPRRGRGVHWWTSVALIALGLLILLAIAIQSFSGQLLMESRYWPQLLQSMSKEHAQLIREGRQDLLPRTGLVRSWYVEGERGRAGVPVHLVDKPPGAYTSESSILGDTLSTGPENGETYHALVVDLPPGRLITQISIEPLEQQQNRYARYSALWVFCFAGVIAGLIAWLHANLVRPVRDLAARMQSIDPSDSLARLPTDYRREEIQIIAHASNAHLERVARFIERERSLLDQASHEFRTPIAVIAGAVDVLKQQPLPTSTGPAMLRIEHAVADLSETMVALLYLAREAPAAGAPLEITALHDLLPRVVQDHEHLLGGKAAVLHVATLEPTFIAAPEAMVRIAAGNLLRNAIENTESGKVELGLCDGVLSITDSGKGFDPAEAARRYRDILRQCAPVRGQGLGLFLIGRICDRFGWALTLDSTERGTRAALDMSPSRVDIG